MSSSDVIPLPMISVPTCCAPPASPAVPLATETKFHFAMNVSDLERSVAFYRVLFGVDPAKHYADYAKFELADPPLVFSLVPQAPGSSGSLSHLGFPVANAEEVAEVARRLEAAGLPVSCQNGTTCGYARQDKIWIADPDLNYWEIYVVYEDIDPETVRRGFDGVAPPTTVAGGSPVGERIIWVHRVLDAAVERIPYADATVDEVQLEGTFNSALTHAERTRLLAEVRRVLKPGGRVHVHGLVSNLPIPGPLPTLPGVAALVNRVPTESEPLDELTAAGFVGGHITKLTESSVFTFGPLQMREIKLTASQLSASAGESGRVVVYKGPFAEALDDDETAFRRGVRTRVSQAQWDRLADSPAAKQFLFLKDQAGCGCG